MIKHTFCITEKEVQICVIMYLQKCTCSVYFHSIFPERERKNTIIFCAKSWSVPYDLKLIHIVFWNWKTTKIKGASMYIYFTFSWKWGKKIEEGFFGAKLWTVWYDLIILVKNRYRVYILLELY